MVEYIGFVDCEDKENGHGTHVAGSAAGGLSESSPGEHFGDGVSHPRLNDLCITTVAGSGRKGGW